ncbi:MobA/MobL family protein [uncultured Fusobacterium sp.]|jgi:exonuclease SbcC|uniref:MobA/MobL family protein n=1 Tax=uncultured Fusobacterium sp. TaxID=159267 RepID=UPI0015A5EA56|nr:MobA/MobL family protein [uncultured Fusobacterium sp.]
MAIYNLRVRPADGRSAVYRYSYILRIDDFSWEKNSKYDDFLFGENINMPSFASENNKYFWECCEEYERENANLFRSIDFSLLAELSDEENIDLATKFAEEIFGNKYVYSLAVHSKPSSKDDVTNIHCHIMFSERELDGIDRDEKEFFKRYNSKNPELGGCKKNQEWTSLSKLYYIRQTWERLANEKLQEKNLELISCKSLKAQRIEAITEDNFLKAEMLDRPPININKKYLDINVNTKEREKAVEFFNYAKQLKEMKEKTFKLKSENFEEENKKAKERFLLEIGAIEGREYNSSDFGITENIVDEHFNFENIFLTSIENSILLDKKEGRLKQLISITNEDIESRALNIVSKGEYPKKSERLKELEEFCSSIPKEKIDPKVEAERKELLDYFENIKNDEVFNTKVGNMMYKISTKMEAEKENIMEDLKFLRDNNFRDFHLERTPENKLRTQEFYTKTLNYISDLKAQKEVQDKKVKEYKEFMKNDIKYELYKAIKPDIAEKYLELLKWKSEEKSGDNRSLEDRIELAKRIKSRELGFKKFNIENNIKEKYEKELSERREHYKNLRQDQDDINGKLSYSFMMLEELKKVKGFELIEEENLLQEKYKNLQTNFDKYEYNIRLSLLQEQHKKIFKKDLEMNEVYVSLNDKEKTEYREKIILEINFLQNELKTLTEKITDKDITDEDLKVRILDKETKGNYSKYKAEISYYKEQIDKGLSVPENYSMLKQAFKVVDKIEKEYIISPEQIQQERQLVNENNIKVKAQISSIKEKLKVNFKLLKGMKTKPKIKKTRPRKNYNHRAGRLKVVKSGKVEIKDETKEREKFERWENEL